MNLEFSRQSFQKSPNTKYHENLSSGSRVVPFGQKGRCDEASSRFSQFCEHASKETDSKQNFDQYLRPIKIYQHTCGQTNTAITHGCLSTIHRKHLNSNCSQGKFDSQPRLQTPDPRTDILAEVWWCLTTASFRVSSNHVCQPSNTSIVYSLEILKTSLYRP
jgi:hypothetical protein